eukprot:m.75507 g.75507  ORF g.75507 m.75507 type:complete len:441 (+) comp35939_c0_seq7:307-1629(+)
MFMESTVTMAILEIWILHIWQLTFRAEAQAEAIYHSLGTGLNNPCYKNHGETCVECVQDPCGRTSRAREYYQSCIFCSDVSAINSSVKAGCVPGNYENRCPLNKITVRSVACPANSKRGLSLRSGCGYISNDNFIVNFTHSFDVTNSQKTLEGTSVTSWISLCNNIQSRQFHEQCGYSASIGAIETDSFTEQEQYCWKIGSEMSQYPNISFVDSGTPSMGVLIDYGSTDCCPTNGSAGQSKRIGVKVVVKPNLADDGKWELEPIDFQRLLNCSKDDDSPLIVQLNSPNLRYSNIEWRLNNLTGAVCYLSGEELLCQIRPSPVHNNSNTLVSVCKKFSSNDMTGNITIMAVGNSVCNVSLPVPVGVCSVTLLYTYPSHQPMIVNINGNHEYTLKCQSTSLRLVEIILPVGIITVLVAIALMCYKLSTKRRRNEEDPLLRDG